MRATESTRHSLPELQRLRTSAGREPRRTAYRQACQHGRVDERNGRLAGGTCARLLEEHARRERIGYQKSELYAASKTLANWRRARMDNLKQPEQAAIDSWRRR